MKRTYDLDQAQKLIPLLDSITVEVVERAQAIRDLSRELRRLRREDGPTEEILNLQADLSIQRRSLRHCTEELEALGCYVDEGHPLAVIIPGPDGTHESGYRWEVGSVEIAQLVSGFAS